ncbi:hypothetical protein V3C99_013257 [Haemonchus contortus]|uniref:Pilus assembly protein n=1 Tax=Haemonchus contortus TaxID=6289 RepID=A0A7I4Y0D0_HAECO
MPIRRLPLLVTVILLSLCTSAAAQHRLFYMLGNAVDGTSAADVFTKILEEMMATMVVIVVVVVVSSSFGLVNTTIVTS